MLGNLYKAIRQALKPWSQPSTGFGVAMIAIIWISIGVQLAVERERIRQDTIQDTSNLARVFEEHIVRTIAETDWELQLLRASYRQHPNFDLRNWLASPLLQSGLLSQIRILGADGRLLAVSGGQTSPNVDFSDRDYFRFHADAPSDDLFISKPLFGRTNKKWLIELSRSIRGDDGSFRGVIGASVDPAYLAKFYESIDVGRHGAIMLAGLDGIVRASAGLEADAVGRSVQGPQLIQKAAQADAGSFLSAGGNDGIKRLVSYRVVKGFPLIVYVGEAEDDILANYWGNRRLYLTAGAGLTALIVIGLAFAIRYRKTLHGVQRELEATLENMSQGIMKVDAARNVAFINRRAIELLGLPDRFLQRNVAHADMLKFQWARGEFGANGEALDPRVRDRMKSRDVHYIGVYQRTRPNGVVLEISTVALPDGGVIRTYTDVTERKQNEMRIAHLLRHDELTSLANRTLLKERIEQALARMQRQGEGFALFCLDLDGFKAVNDTHGHPAGDLLLRAVAERLSSCVRETDTVARLGGDEFAVLQAATEREDDAEALAKRILEAVSTPYDLDGQRAVIGTSVGIAMAPRDGADMEELLKIADISLYRAKAEGPNAYRFYGRGAERNAPPRRLLAGVR
jgi:diguanylate cyclase (GGDEF)-like protein